MITHHIGPDTDNSGFFWTLCGKMLNDNVSLTVKENEIKCKDCVKKMKNPVVGRADHWVRTLKLAGLEQSNLSDKAFEYVLKKYSEPGRKYHNMEHILSCFRVLDEVFSDIENRAAIEFAIWYHDVIYNPKYQDNEEQSARIAREDLVGLGLIDEGNKAYKLILATKHDGEAKDEAAKIMLDVDLSILSEPEDVYDAYEKAIREEYSFVPEKEFKHARRNIMRGFLNRPKIYLTEQMSEREEAARKNIERHWK